MKKVHFYILTLIIAIFCLAGCKIQTVEQYNNQNADEKSVDDSSEKVIPVNDKKKQDHQTNKKNTESDQQVDQKTNSKETVKKSDESNQVVTKSTNNQEKELHTANKEIRTSNKNTNQEKKTTNLTLKEQNSSKNISKKTETPSKKETVASKKANSAKSIYRSNSTDNKIVKEKKKYVTISVRVDTLLKEENYAKLEKPLQNEKYVPKSGTIIATSKYEIRSDNDSAWSITLRALKEHHVQFEYDGAGANKYGSVYIQGINHLYEKNAGPLSGWMYSVNGKNPGIGCDGYKVKDGDQIVWQYSLNEGKDIGLK